jgi:hypothetical protein
MTVYYGVALDPVPDHPTKEQALEAISALSSGSLRYEYISYYYQIAKNYIKSSQAYKEDSK